MTATKLLFALSIVVLAAMAPARAQDTAFEDCLLERLQGTQSDLAARWIVIACLRKSGRYDASEPSSRSKQEGPEGQALRLVTDPEILRQLEEGPDAGPR